MGIDSLSIYERYANIYSQYGLDRVGSINVAPEKQEEAKVQEVNNAPEASENYIEIRKPNAPIEDISLTSNKLDDFSYLGKDANIELLDIEKAMSDVEKDSIFKKYQFFVGNSPEMTENGAVIIK